MNIASTIIIALLFTLLSLAPLANGADLEVVKRIGSQAESGLVRDFTEALYRRNHMAMREIVARNRNAVAIEANKTLDAALAPDTTKESRETIFYILERLTTEFKMITGDNTVPMKIKKRIFESRLSPAVDAKETGVLHVIKNIIAGTAQKSLAPNNIIINSGETVKWTNNNSITARLASVMSTGGKKEILSPKIAPGESWEHTFYTPGEYYYISFPNNVLYGKVVVAE
jgi:plastocyanin